MTTYTVYSSPITIDLSCGFACEVDLTDSLSLPLLQSLLPPGVAWTREPGTELYELCLALSYEFARVKKRGKQLLEELDPRTTLEMLEDWERVYGLPDACVTPTTIAGRRAALLAKFIGFGDPSVPNLITIGTQLGYADTAINEYVHDDLFVCTSTCIEYLYGADWMFVWEVTATSGDVDDVQRCSYEQIAPDHTIVNFYYTLDWTSRTSGVSNDFFGVAYGAGLWVVVGSSGKIMTSPDGITWTSRTSGVSDALYGVIYANSLFVAVGAKGSGNGKIVTSPDGITWTTRSSGTANDLNAVGYDFSLFVVVGDNGVILTSPTGVTWTSRTSGTGQNLQAVATDGTTMAVVGNTVVLSSTNATSWTSRTPSIPSISWLGLFYALDAFVAVGAGGKVMASDDGITWSDRSILTTENLNAITSDSSRLFLAVGDNGTSRTSWDDYHWLMEDNTSETVNLYAAAYANNLWVAVGATGKIATSAT